MLQIKSFEFSPIQENTYLLFNENKDAVIIDPGCYFEEEKEQLKNFIEENYGLMYGVYEGLIKHKRVSKKMLYDCFITNRLDELTMCFFWLKNRIPIISVKHIHIIVCVYHFYTII